MLINIVLTWFIFFVDWQNCGALLTFKEKVVSWQNNKLGAFVIKLLLTSGNAMFRWTVGLLTWNSKFEWFKVWSSMYLYSLVFVVLYGVVSGGYRSGTDLRIWKQSNIILHLVLHSFYHKFIHLFVRIWNQANERKGVLCESVTKISACALCRCRQ